MKTPHKYIAIINITMNIFAILEIDIGSRYIVCSGAEGGGGFATGIRCK